MGLVYNQTLEMICEANDDPRDVSRIDGCVVYDRDLVSARQLCRFGVAFFDLGTRRDRRSRV